MVTMNNTPSTITAHRGGRAVMFIYIGVFLICAPIGTLLKVPPYYLWIAIGLLAVAAGTFLPKYLFAKPVIKADAEGLWTQRNGLIAWEQISDIKMEKREKNPFSTSVANTDVYLCIETKDGYTEEFDLLYLNVDYNAFPQQLINLWKQNQPAQ